MTNERGERIRRSTSWRSAELRVVSEVEEGRRKKERCR